jgi:hypothetical protein
MKQETGTHSTFPSFCAAAHNADSDTAGLPGRCLSYFRRVAVLMAAEFQDNHAL